MRRDETTSPLPDEPVICLDFSRQVAVGTYTLEVRLMFPQPQQPGAPRDRDTMNSAT